MAVRDKSGALRAASMVAALLWTALVHADSWPQPPPPPGAATSEVARRMVFNGIDMRAQVFQSNRPAADVIAYYRQLWKPGVVVNRLGNAQVIAHRAGDYFITVQVRDFDGGSKGEVGVTDVATVRKNFVPGDGVPLPMGSKVFNDIAYPDDPTPARTVAMRNGLSPQQNATFFRDRLTADGWKPSDANQCPTDTCVLRYERGDSKMTLVLSPVEGQSQVMINLLNP
jgi:hypothetical protein